LSQARTQSTAMTTNRLISEVRTLTKRQKLPEIAKCVGCGRNLDVSRYLSDLPPANVPDERITWRVVPQGTPAYTLHCACGHYTVNAYFERSKR